MGGSDREAWVDAVRMMRRREQARARGRAALLKLANSIALWVAWCVLLGLQLHLMMALWAWFIVPATGVQPLSPWGAYGLFVLIRVAASDEPTGSDERRTTWLCMIRKVGWLAGVALLAYVVNRIV